MRKIFVLLAALTACQSPPAAPPAPDAGAQVVALADYPSPGVQVRFNSGSGTRAATIDFTGASGSCAGGTCTVPVTGAGGGVPTSRTLTAGAGLTGGGDLSADRTFDVAAGDGITVNANDVAVDSTVVRTSGVQSIAGVKTFSDAVVVTSTVADANGDGIKVNDGDGYASIITGNTNRIRCGPTGICGSPNESATTGVVWTPAGALSAQVANVTTGTTACVNMANPTAAVVGTQVQRSCTSDWLASGWDVNDATARAVTWKAQAIPVAGNTVTATLDFSSSVAPGSLTSRMSIDTSGNLTVGNSIIVPSVGPLLATQHALTGAMSSGTLGVLNATQVIDTSGAQAANTTARTTRALGATAGNDITSTLGNAAFAGQRKTLVLSNITAAKTWVVTPTAFADGTSITMIAPFDGAELEWSAALGQWFVISKTGTTAINP